MTLTASGGLVFGIYPGGIVGDDVGGLTDGPPDDAARMTAVLDQLQGREDRPCPGPQEPDITSNPLLDSFYPNVHDAIVRGVSATKWRARELGRTSLRVGFNTTPPRSSTASCG